MTLTMRIKTLGAALIILVGLLNFHVPHFVLERSGFQPGASWLELVFLTIVLGAVIAAVGIWRTRRWGWLLGIAVVIGAFALYLIQELVGLPGLPQNWLEPSRIVSLLFDALFIVVACKYIGTVQHAPTVANR
jgi:hypothetical protein